MERGTIFIIVSILMITFFLTGLSGQSDQQIDIRVFIIGEEMGSMEAIREKCRGMGVDMGEPLYHVPYQLVILTDTGQIDEILSWEEVERIQFESDTEVSQNISARSVKAAGSEMYSPNTAHDLGYRGEGMVIAVLDGGVDNEHPAFRGAFVAGVDVTTPESPLTPRDGTHDPDDNEGHGTAVASVALGRGDHMDPPRYVGVAPEAGLIDVKMRKMGPQLEQPLAMALEWCLENLDTDWKNGWRGIDVISISAGLGNQDGPAHELIWKCVENGTPVVSAATNSGAPFEDDGQGANYWPDDSIIVGGTDDKDTVDRSDDDYWSQSTWGPRSDDGDSDLYDEFKPDISAPAYNIRMAQVNDLPGSSYTWGYASGTSYATPHVSATVALMLQANSDIAPDENENPVMKILHSTAEARGEPYDASLSSKYNVHYGYGILDTYEAVIGARDHENKNSPPLIREFEIIPSTTTVGSTCSVSIDAYDEDQEALFYSFQVDGGVVTGEFPQFFYVAPDEPGNYSVKLTVSDGRGGADTAQSVVEVTEGGSNDPPVIISLEADPEVIAPGGESVITVETEDPDDDNLQMNWFSSSGTISGEGVSVTLVADDAEETIIVGVEVEDPFGGMDSKEVRVRVIDEEPGNPPYIEKASLLPERIRQGETSFDVILEVKVTSSDSVIMRVEADLSSMDNGTVELEDDGKYPDSRREDSIYTLKLPPVRDLDNDLYPIIVTATDATGRTSEVKLTLTVQAPADQQMDSRGNDINPITLVAVSMIVLLTLVLVYAVVRITKREPR